MPYTLKPESEVFTAVDGPCAGTTFRHGTTYDAVPAAEKHKFTELGGKEPEARKKAKEKPAPDAWALNPDDGGDQS